MDGDMILRNIGENVRRLRGELSYSEVARRCSTKAWTCYPAHIEKLEKGQHQPGVLLLFRVAEVLGVDLNQIIAAPKRTRKKSAA